MRDDSAITLLNNVWQGGKRRGRTGIPLREHIYIRALCPFHVNWSMNGFLNILSIKV